MGLMPDPGDFGTSQFMSKPRYKGISFSNMFNFVFGSLLLIGLVWLLLVQFKVIKIGCNAAPDPKKCEANQPYTPDEPNGNDFFVPQSN